MKVLVRSILYRRIGKSNAGAFLGGNKGQYDLRLGKSPSIRRFAEDIAEERPTSLGGWTKTLKIAPYQGTDPVDAKELRLRYMGPRGSRADETYIASQSSDPYPLWDPQRTRIQASTEEDLIGDVAIIVKDVDENLHARWIRREDIGCLPMEFQKVIKSSDGGVFDLNESNQVPSTQAREIFEALKLHFNVLLYGPPGTGKTHLVTEVRQLMEQNALSFETNLEHREQFHLGGGSVHHAWATFHQSYSYEDFLIGLRPQPLPAGGFDLVPHPGILLELSEWARYKDRSSLLIIDEINRGNVSRIFGEFITLMEPGKRLDSSGQETVQTVSVRLPFLDAKQHVDVSLPDGSAVKVPTPFTMPRRVYTLATMNSVDKSVAPLDAALRRRFHLVNVQPRLDTFRSRLGLDDRAIDSSVVPVAPATLEDFRWLAIGLMEILNRRISLYLGPDFQLGEWFLKPLMDTTDSKACAAALADVWRHALMPQLEDYFVGRADQLARVLGDPTGREQGLINDVPVAEDAELGAVRSIRANPSATDRTLVRLMTRIVHSDFEKPPPVAEFATDIDVAGSNPDQTAGGPMRSDVYFPPSTVSGSE